MQLSAGDRFSQIFIGEFPVCNRGRSSCRPEKLVLRGFRQRWPAMLYSQIGTYRLNNVDPEKWLRYVIEHIQDWPANRVRDLLPWKVDLTSQ